MQVNAVHTCASGGLTYISAGPIKQLGRGGMALVMLAQQAPQPVAPNARRVVMLLAVVVAGLLMGSAIFAATRLVSVGGN